MLRGIPGIESLKIGDGELKWSDGTACTLPVLENGDLVIPIGGKVVIKPYTWFENLAFHRVFISKELLENIEKLDFVDTYVFSKANPVPIMPVLREPVLVEGKYRLIARYSRYAVDEHGELFDLKRRIPVYALCEIAGYICQCVWDGVHGKHNNVPLHRLLGLAWIDNDNFLEKYLINHKNGVKKDIELSNLEWSSYAYNNMHAVRELQRETCIKGRLRSMVTGIEQSFSSFTQACEMMGTDNRLQFTPSAKPGFLWNDEYEVRLDGDDTPWFYENKTERVDVGRYKTTVTYPDGKVEVFYNAVDLLSHFGVKTTGGRTLPEYVASLQRRKPYLVIEMVDLADANRELRFQRRLTRNQVKGTQCIEAHHEKDQKTLTLPSLYATSDHFKVDRKSIREHIKKQTPWKGWMFKRNPA